MNKINLSAITRTTNSLKHYKAKDVRTPYRCQESTLTMTRAQYQGYLSEDQKKGISGKESREVAMKIGQYMGIKYPVTRIDFIQE